MHGDDQTGVAAQLHQRRRDVLLAGAKDESADEQVVLRREDLLAGLRVLAVEPVDRPATDQREQGRAAHGAGTA